MRPSSVLFARSAGFTIQLFKKSSLKNLSPFCSSSSTNSSNKINRSLPTEDLRSEKVTICVNSQKVTVDAILQDTMPGGSNVGTVVAVHGVPGSHKDFKYLLPPLKDADIRLICVNFPGLGYTLDSAVLQHTNQERSDYVQAIVERLGLSNKLVFMGHSRGSENALRLGARNADRCAGVMLVNPIGLRPNRRVRPFSAFKVLAFLWNLGSFTRLFMRPFLYWLFNSVLKFRVPTGDQAAVCLQVVANSDFPSQYPIIKELNNRPDVAVLVAYGGSDPLIEPEISRELADAFHAGREIVCHGDGHNSSTASHELDRMLHDGHAKVAVRFEKETHFLQKNRAVFLTDAIRSMFARNKQQLH